MRRFFSERRARRKESRRNIRNTSSQNDTATNNPPQQQQRQQRQDSPRLAQMTNQDSSSAAAAGNNNNNNNEDDQNDNVDTTDQIALDLEHVEEQLQRGPGNVSFRASAPSSGASGGRAAFESVATALTSLRRRLSRSVRGSNVGAASSTTRSSTTASSPSAAAAAAEEENDDNDNNDDDTRHSSLMQRLETAEMAHSNRIPLGLLQQEMERRRAQPMESVERRKSTEGNASSANAAAAVGKPKQDTTTAAADAAAAEDAAAAASAGSSSDGENSASSASSSSIFGMPGSRRRRASTLMASRSRDEALQRQSRDRQLHSLGNLDTLASLPTVSEDEETSKSLELQTQQEDAKQTTTTTTTTMMKEETSSELLREEESAGAGAPILLTDRSRSRLLAQSSSTTNLLLASSSVVSADMDTNNNNMVAAATAPSSQTVVYSWGTEGAHSLHDNDDIQDQRTTPKDAKVGPGQRVARHSILSASVGSHHSAVVSTTGQLLICGANDHGQVDPSRRMDEPVIRKPTVFEFPSAMTRVTQVSCGAAHTAAVTHTGTVLTWGQNDVGQLGHRRKSGSIPTAMTGVSRAAQVSCGDQFTTVLTTRMQLWVCGCPEVVTWNAAAVENNEPPLPALIPSLAGVPLVKTIAGARHVVLLSAAGTALAFGENVDGCCSRAFPKSIHTPVPVIFTSDNLDASDSSQQQQQHDELATPFPHWTHTNENEPIQLEAHVAIEDAACGNGFTLLLTKTGQVYVCGKNEQGQLGSSSSGSENDTSPILTATLLNVPAAGQENVKFVSVAAGQNQSLLLDDKGQVWSMGGLNHQPLQVVLADSHIQSIAAGGHEMVAIAPALPPRSSDASAIQREFSIKTSDDLMDQDRGTGADVFVVEQLMANPDDHNSKAHLIRRIHDFFSSPTVWNSLFWDPADCADLYEQLLAPNDVAVAKAMEQAMLQGLESMQTSDARLLHPESVRFLLLFLQCPLFLNPKVGKTNNGEDETKDGGGEEEEMYEFDSRGEVALTLCESFLNLPFEGYKAVQRWAASCYGPKYFASLLVKPLIAMLERGLADGAGAKSRVIPGTVTLLRWFHGSSQRNPSLAKPSDFYSEAIGDMDPESLYEDLKKWKDNNKRSGTYFLSANTFLLSPTTKRTLLMIENQVEMLRAATSNLTWDREQHQFVFDPFFVLAIDREHMLTQTLQKISAASHVELRKSLKIVFKGEDAVDAGGVTKEFFQLLGHQLFDTSTGMWSTEYGDNVTWFNGDCTWNEEGYYLVGVLTGLSIYNDVLMDVHFPRALYRKLLGYSLGLEDMVDEETKRGMQQLLDYEGDDVEDIFCLTFEHTWMDMGMSRSIELKDGGADIPVTSENKEEYVLLYLKWLLVDSVAAQYDAFERGVMQVLESSSLDLLQPEELELLLVGSPDLDIDAWQSKTEYEGFEADSLVIQNFWKFVRNSSRDDQLKLLKFATGTSRAPIGGLGAMVFKIQRAGADSEQLPTSHTCFNILIMPDYGDNYEKLERLLGRAILECEGFGLQ